MDITNLSATELAARLRTRELRAIDVADAYLERIGARDADIHAWACVDAEFTRQQARALDAGPVAGPLHGVPVAVKDIVDTADLPTEYGSPIYRGHRPTADAQCVAAARAAGAVVLGKTVTTELAFLSPAATVNPRNFAHTPGGSSSGSAAAVADHMAPLAFGTQTGGSVIRPASFCGIVGYKPSYGWVDRAGVKPFAESLDTVGAFARTVADAGLLIGAVTSRRELLELPHLDGRPSVAACRTHDWTEVSTAGQQALEQTVKRLRAAGAQVSWADLPTEFAALGDAQGVIQGYEAARNLAFERRAHGAQLSTVLRQMLDRGGDVSFERYELAQRLASACRARLAAVLGDCSVLLAPSTTGEAPRGLESTGSPVMNRVWTLLHVPCVTVPVAEGPLGLPLGAQVIGRDGDDARTLATADWIQRHLE